MTPVTTRFLLNTLPAEVANSYFHRTYGWQPIDDSTGPRTVFIRHTGKTPQQIYHKTADTFPDSCRLLQNGTAGSIFLISANPLEFCRILAFLTEVEDQILLPEIENLLAPESQAVFRIQDQVWQREQPRIMGILNITPDSFFDGGRYYQKEDYAAIAGDMIAEGADIIDIGGESSRPGAAVVDETEELNRVLNAVKQIRRRFTVPLSIDTVKPAVADAALDAGVDMVNDISGLAAGREMLRIVRKHNASYCLMHIQGTPETMQDNPHYTDVISDIIGFFQSTLKICREAGLEKDRILLDPGIGFGKTVLNNVDILRLLPAFSAIGCLILLGTSNKSFIGRLLEREVNDRVTGTMATQALGWMQGASVFRVHDIREARDTLEIARYHTRSTDLD